MNPSDKAQHAQLAARVVNNGERGFCRQPYAPEMRQEAAAKVDIPGVGQKLRAAKTYDTPGLLPNAGESSIAVGSIVLQRGGSQRLPRDVERRKWLIAVVADDLRVGPELIEDISVV